MNFLRSSARSSRYPSAENGFKVQWKNSSPTWWRTPRTVGILWRRQAFNLVRCSPSRVGGNVAGRRAPLEVWKWRLTLSPTIPSMTENRDLRPYTRQRPRIFRCSGRPRVIFNRVTYFAAHVGGGSRSRRRNRGPWLDCTRIGRPRSRYPSFTALILPWACRSQWTPRQRGMGPRLAQPHFDPSHSRIGDRGPWHLRARPRQRLRYRHLQP